MIGFFDSGFGGMTVLKEVFKKFSQYKYVYLGDTARVPYGNRSPKVIFDFSRQAVDYLFELGCQLVIVACNTASADALPRLQQEWLPFKYPERRILGVIRPMVEKAVEITQNNKIGVLATRGTIISKAYQREFFKLNPDISVFAKAAPLLVPLLEEGWINHQITKKVLRIYLRQIKQKSVDVLIPGCTHYSLLQKQIGLVMGKRVRVIDVGKTVAESLDDYLKRHLEMEVKLKHVKSPTVDFLTTDKSLIFDTFGSRFWGGSIKSRKVDISANK